MAAKAPLRYSGKDTNPWKVIDRMGKILKDAAGKSLTGLDGFKSANEVAAKHGGVAVRA